MAFGDLKGTLGAHALNVGSTNDLTGSVSVSVGDLVFAAFSQQNNLTASGASDNLGNSYSALNAGTDAGIATGRAFWARVTTAGTLTAVTVSATSSANNFAGAAAVIEGPFATSPLDANPANNTDAASPFTCPATGTLAQADEVVMCYHSSSSPDAKTATSPNLLAKEELGSACAATIGYQTVSATTSVAPEFTGNNPGSAVNITASFKKEVSAGASGTIAQTLPKLAQAATATMHAAGTIAQTLPNPEQSATAAEGFTGTAEQTLPNVDQVAAATEIFFGTAAQALPNLEQAAAGAESFSGNVAQTLPGVAQAAAGSEGFTGTAASALPRLAQAATGVMHAAGTIAQTLARLVQSASGQFGDVVEAVAVRTFSAMRRRLRGSRRRR